jgi:hypothetical protein
MYRGCWRGNLTEIDLREDWLVYGKIMLKLGGEGICIQGVGGEICKK